MIAKHDWMPAEDEIIRTHYPHMATIDVVAMLGDWASANTVVHRAKKLKIRKSPEFISKIRIAAGSNCKSSLRYGTLVSKFPFIRAAMTDKDGYIQVVINKYVMLHREVWRRHYGEIPPRHAIRFKDGDKQNVDIDNLYMVPMEDVVREATSVPEELREVVRLKRKILRAIKNGEK